jgi:hypothetical protein
VASDNHSNLGCFVIPLLTIISVGCSPRNKWISDRDHHIPYIYSDWIGTTTSRTVFAPDGSSYEVLALIPISGPHRPSAAGNSRSRRDDSVEFITDAANGMIPARDVPLGIRVHVDGFTRGAYMDGVIYNPTKGFFQSAFYNPPVLPVKSIDYFPVIKAKTIYSVNSSGMERLIWHKKMRWAGL